MIHPSRPSKQALLRSALCLTLILFGTPAVALAQQVQTAVVATAAPDFSSGAHSVIAVDPIGGPRRTENEFLPTGSDITIAAHENHFYRIEKFMANNVTKFDIAAPDEVIWQYTTQAAGEINDSNPYDLIFVSSQKAYLLRYGSARAWIVNPSAATQADFKIGELDLSAYDGGGGVPHMSSAVIADGKLFLAMQRLDSSWKSSKDAYVAVFNVNTNEEIDTGTPNYDGLKGIRLPIRNTGAIQYLAANNTIYVQGAGDLFGGGSQMDFPSGIVSIDPDTFSVDEVIPGGAPYGNISGMSIVSPEKAYFVGYAGWGDNTLYAFNPTTGGVEGPANPRLENINLAGLESGAYVDKNGMLWVSDQTNARLVILDTETGEIDEIIDTGLNPIRVAFTTQGEPGSGSSLGGSSGGCFVSSSTGSASFWN